MNRVHTTPLYFCTANFNTIFPPTSRSFQWYLSFYAAGIGEKRNAYRVLVGKPEGKKPLGRPRRRWLDNVMMELGDRMGGGIDWISLA
jgi:hypothetical protein